MKRSSAIDGQTPESAVIFGGGGSIGKYESGRLLADGWLAHIER